MDDIITDQLLAAIRSSTRNDRVEWASPPSRLTGGFTTAMWRVRLDGAAELDGSLVARVMPDAEGARRETAIQRHLAHAGFPTPPVRLAGGPGPDLASAWMVMDHVAGAPLLDDLEGGSVVRSAPRLLRELPGILARCAADLHAQPIGGLRDELVAGDAVVDLVERMRARMEEADRVDLIAVADGLIATRPQRTREVICHGDLHPLNVLAGPGGPVVLDWSTARISDPAYDLAFTALLLSRPPITGPAVLGPPMRAAGRLLRRRFLRAYVRHARNPIDAVQMQWFTRLSALRILSELEVTIDPSSHPFRHLEPAARALARL